ncbi:uncharacterized protein [Pocillopora verrucosa]|uniref:Uncharacterized protein n=1 Tax=Pocillopora meandrina TaxID=46732 RepID=A0AAU9WJN8_9CNID|nr:uncharacterized protein LOC131783722 [Pocillopora verrucosa]CAH3115733.1 unnamed protein product [Pocillopora meandrina]
MAAGQTSGSKNLNDFESVLELVHRQANKFFTGMQVRSGMSYSIEDAKTDLDGLSKLTDTLHEKLLSSGVNAIPLDSEMLQLDYQATVRKGQEEADLNRITLQRVQTNCAALNKAMNIPRKS